MLTFEEFKNIDKSIQDEVKSIIGESLIIEMPHVMIDGGNKAIDLELEIHSKLTAEQMIKYFEDWIAGKPMQSKNPKHIQTLPKEFVPEFAKSLLSKPFLKNFVEYHYDTDTWDKIEKLLRSNLT